MSGNALSRDWATRVWRARPPSWVISGRPTVKSRCLLSPKSGHALAIDQRLLRAVSGYCVMPAPRPAVIGQRPIASKARELSKKKSQLRRPSGSRSKLDDHAGALFHFEGRGYRAVSLALPMASASEFAGDHTHRGDLPTAHHSINPIIDQSAPTMATNVSARCSASFSYEAIHLTINTGD